MKPSFTIPKPELLAPSPQPNLTQKKLCVNTFPKNITLLYTYSPTKKALRSHHIDLLTTPSNLRKENKHLSGLYTPSPNTN
jgi:hypothetical protein